MKKSFKRVLTAVLSTATVLSFSSAVFADVASEKINANEGSRFIDLSFEGEYWEEDIEEINKHVVDLTDPEKMEDMIKRSPEYRQAVKDAAEKGIKDVPIQKAVPTSVDLSQKAAFPEIKDQQAVGSCAAFSTVYYQFTYEVNRMNNTTATIGNSYSPDWAYYSVVNETYDEDGNRKEGTLSADMYEFTREHGAVKWNELVPKASFDTSHPMPSNEAMLAALSTRISEKNTVRIDTIVGESSPNVVGNAQFNAVKSLLAQGHVLRVSSHAGWWGMYTSSNEECVVRFFANGGFHSYCVVGYNDSIWVDVNENGVKDSGETGAFKIANSWGTAWGNNGYAWVLYDALNEESFISGNWEDQFNTVRWPAFCTTFDSVNYFDYIDVSNYENYFVVQTDYTNTAKNLESVQARVSISGNHMNRTAEEGVKYTGVKTFSSFLDCAPLIYNPEAFTHANSTFKVWKKAGVDQSKFSAKLVDNKGNLIADMAFAGTEYSTDSLRFSKGDVDYNTRVNAKDIIVVKRIILNPEDASTLQFYLADYNDDGKVNAKDLTAIQQAMLG